MPSNIQPCVHRQWIEISTTYTSENLNTWGLMRVPGMTGRIYAGRSDGGIDISGTCGDAAADGHTSSRWFFEVCDQSDADCKDALGDSVLSWSIFRGLVASDWNTGIPMLEKWRFYIRHTGTLSFNSWLLLWPLWPQHLYSSH